MMIKAVFVGSFDPFTVGHYDIVQRALPLFDRLIIGVGINERKVYMNDTETRVADIIRIFNNNPKIEVRTYNDLTVDFAKRVGATFIVKGVRSVKDFEYEREQADINRRISGIDTLLICADPQHASVSSSMVRELIHFGRDVSEFLPKF